jgi:hypothetical protein
MSQLLIKIVTTAFTFWAIVYQRFVHGFVEFIGAVLASFNDHDIPCA